MINEIKRIVKDSEIMKYETYPTVRRQLTRRREDDSKWPPKNKDGRQELEIRMGNEHISFEVGPATATSNPAVWIVLSRVHVI